MGVTALDTAYNYRAFTSHHALAELAGDLLDEFTISTKVGFFPRPGGGSGTEHSLAPARLRQAVEACAADLGRPPDVVLLHNPEWSLTGPDSAAGGDRLAAACTVLAGAVAAGLCRSWGISSWDTRPLLAALTTTAAATAPAPEVLMVRAGLLVKPDVLDASTRLAARFDLELDARWGMSPFGGNAAHPVWSAIDARTFLAPHQENCTRLQAALGCAFALPQVSRIAVSTSSAEHLRELVAATTLEVDHDRIGRYRTLLGVTTVSDQAKAVSSPATARRAGPTSGPP